MNTTPLCDPCVGNRRGNTIEIIKGKKKKKKQEGHMKSSAFFPSHLFTCVSCPVWSSGIIVIFILVTYTSPYNYQPPWCPFLDLTNSSHSTAARSNWSIPVILSYIIRINCPFFRPSRVVPLRRLLLSKFLTLFYPRLPITSPPPFDLPVAFSPSH